MHAAICEAINERKIIQFYYKNYLRKVEPYTLGTNRKNNDILSAYQIGGESEKNDFPSWKLFNLSDIENLQLLDENFYSPQRDYKKGDSRMIKIYCEF